jgi:ankyrin repeat protein
MSRVKVEVTSPRGALSSREVLSPRGLSSPREESKDNGAVVGRLKSTEEEKMFMAYMALSEVDEINSMLEKNPDLIKRKYQLEQHLQTDETLGRVPPILSALSFCVGHSMQGSEAFDSTLATLTEAGGFKYDKNLNGSNALMLMAIKGRMSVVKTLVELYEIELDDQGITGTEQALKMKEYLNQQNKLGGTALHYAAIGVASKNLESDACSEIMLYLMSKGADANIQDKDKKTPTKYLPTKAEQVKMERKYTELNAKFLQDNGISSAISK